MRYLPHTETEIKEMLNVIGANDIEDLFACIPKDLRLKKPLDIRDGMPEAVLVRHMDELSKRNLSADKTISFLGGGAYRHYIPAAVKELAGRAEFVTPYTPYQPEISQGTLQTIFEYQSMMCRIFEMDVCNASHYDAATSLADAALMARRVAKNRRTICVADNLHPEYKEVLHTVLGNDDTDIHIIPSENGIFNRAALKDSLNKDLAAVIVQFPNFLGIVEDLKDVAEMAHKEGALLITVVPEPLALGILNPPGNFGADIAVGEGLSFGLPLSFGGPTLGIFTAKKELLRAMPGRICGQTTDSKGRRGYVLTISTREQHIRREKATSNICSNQALCATTAAIYLSLLGKTGFKKLAELNFKMSEYAKKCLTGINGVNLKFNHPTFNEFVLEFETPAKTVLKALLKENIFGGIDLGKWYAELNNCLLICATEMNTKQEIENYTNKLAKVLRG